MTATSDPLPAIAESEATGDIAVLFEDIRQSLGVPVVNLIFRHLATFPQALPWCWETLKPLYVDGTIDAQADALRQSLSFPLTAGISRKSLSEAGLSGTDLTTIQMILRSYERSNAMNLVAFSALLAKLSGHHATEQAHAVTASNVTNENVAAGVRGEMPKPLALAEMNEQTRAMTLHLAKFGGADAIMPTMYRHLAHWPQYLSLVSELLTPLDQQQVLQPAVKAVVCDGKKRGMSIGLGLGQSQVPLSSSSRAAVVETTEVFLEGVIAKMIVIVGVIKQGMPADA